MSQNCGTEAARGLMSTYDNKDLVSIRVFMTPELRKQLKVKAAQCDRSMNDLITAYVWQLCNGEAEVYPPAPRDENQLSES